MLKRRLWQVDMAKSCNLLFYSNRPSKIRVRSSLSSSNQCRVLQKIHIFLPNKGSGVRKEEIKVELEDSRYLIIRTEAIDESTEPAKSFMRKFRLPSMIDVDGISAGYEDGVLTVTVPRSFVRRGFYIDPGELPEQLELLARAA